MRINSVLIVGTLVSAPLAAQAPSDASGRPFFLRKAEPPSIALQAYQEKPYLPVRASEVRSAGFLTEEQEMVFGRAIGNTAPGEARTQGSPAMTGLGSWLSVEAPEGGSYAVGDTLIVAIVSQGPKGWGDRVIPTGMAVVTATNARQADTRILAIYGALRGGQAVFRVEPIANPGEVKPVAVVGPVGAVISAREVRELLMPAGHLFTDLGQRDGVKLGDFVEVRRDATDTDVPPMATGQVVHVSANSSTVKLMNVLSPHIVAGNAVVRVATLP